MPKVPPHDLRSLQDYTSGHWLYRDREECEARRISFDFTALCDKVIECCPGASSIKAFQKIEGGYNKVILFTTDNDDQLVAKLPTSVAGPAKLTTASEVATITYLQRNTTIPIPKVLDWDEDSSNAVGSEYLLMEHAPGSPLHQVWPQMTTEQQVHCIHSISSHMAQMANLRFSAYGSLYFHDTRVIDEAHKLALDPSFCIGPHTGIRYWNCSIGETRYYDKDPNRGPWRDLPSYCSALIDCGLSRLPQRGTKADPRTLRQETVSEHVKLLRMCSRVLQKLIQDPRLQDTQTPTMLHPDLHKRQIFVDQNNPTVITAIIDWQSTSIEPAFYYADENPDFAMPATDEDPFERHICRQAFESCIAGLIPKVGSARSLDDSLLQVFRLCHRTWIDGDVALKHELIELANRWKDLGLPDSCPFPVPTQEEIAQHEQQFEQFRNAYILKRNVVEHLGTTSDGWVPSELWTDVRRAHREAFNLMDSEVAKAEDPSFTTAHLRTQWPFDDPSTDK